MPDFVKAVDASKVPPDSMLTVQVGAESVLIANVDGRYYGIGAVCRHQGWDLSEGTLADTEVTCAGHGTVWDLKTGKGIYDEPLEDEPLYDVKEEDGILYVRKRTF
ncbi:MAG TPA: Rieske 2Fe-2S domain-containing protein [Nitrososphaerales archaeon]|nr:Rieske 2Fe-2S domain-containing protein [Nitrososphaerales archaeon]